MTAPSPKPASQWNMGKPLLIASHNHGKITEVREMIAPFAIEVLSASDVKLDEPEETGSSFAENAELKARHAQQHSGMASLADDSGLVIPALDGAPGIYSARWAGPDKDFSVAFERIQHELAAKQVKEADAYFISLLCLCDAAGKSTFFEGRINGKLVFPPRGDKGFGYDPIFIPDGHEKTFAELGAAEKNAISHRAKAFKKFIEFVSGHA